MKNLMSILEKKFFDFPINSNGREFLEKQRKPLDFILKFYK
jgi:hypothetical protein